MKISEKRKARILRTGRWAYACRVFVRTMKVRTTGRRVGWLVVIDDQYFVPYSGTRKVFFSVYKTEKEACVVAQATLDWARGCWG